MSISRVKTWQAGDQLLASDLNTEFDNITDVIASTGATATISAAWTFSTDPVLNNNAVGWTKVDKTGSSLADLATRSAADLSSGSLPLARIAPGTEGQVLKTVSGSTAWDTGVRINFGPFLISTASSSTTSRMEYEPAGTGKSVIGVGVAQSGSITGISYFMDPDGSGGYTNNITAGNLDIRVRKNFVEVWTAATLTSGSSTTGSATQAVGSDTFAANDEMDVVVVGDGSYAESSSVQLYVYLELSL